LRRQGGQRGETCWIRAASLAYAIVYRASDRNRGVAFVNLNARRREHHDLHVDPSGVHRLDAAGADVRKPARKSGRRSVSHNEPTLCARVLFKYFGS
jgi:hypothetical protein